MRLPCRSIEKTRGRGHVFFEITMVDICSKDMSMSLNALDWAPLCASGVTTVSPNTSGNTPECFLTILKIT